MSDIFISYAKPDRPDVERLAPALEGQGWSVFWAGKIHAGKRFAKVIESELDDSKCVIVLWSEAALESQWVEAEAGEGFKRRTVIPVLIEDVEQPLQFRPIQAARLTDWKKGKPIPKLTDLEEGAPAPLALRQLFAAVSDLLDEPASVEAEPTPKIEGEDPERRTSKADAQGRTDDKPRRKAEAAKHEQTETEVKPKGEEQAKPRTEQEKTRKNRGPDDTA